MDSKTREFIKKNTTAPIAMAAPVLKVSDLEKYLADKIILTEQAMAKIKYDVIQEAGEHYYDQHRIIESGSIDEIDEYVYNWFGGYAEDLLEEILQEQLKE